MKLKRAAAYVRVSSFDQNTEAQERHCENTSSVAAGLCTSSTGMKESPERKRADRRWMNY
jgi:DNA invertase Pin-like site-specific DNA recombinase